jgi:hypothetical protein
VSRRDALRALPLLALIAALAAFVSWEHARPSLAQGGGPRMELDVLGGGATCDVTPHPDACTVTLNTTFTLAVDAVAPPAGGYVGFQTELFYDGLTYQPRPVADELVWPESALPARFPVAPGGTERVVDHGDLSATTPPFPVSMHDGRLVEIHVTCSLESSTFTLALIPYSAPDHLLGAGYKDAQTGLTTPAKTAGQASIDLDGDGAPEMTGVADSVQLNCGLGGPTSTPPTRTPTSTRTRTPTPEGATGDASCDGMVNSVDALLILQLVADLLEAFNCPANVDVNGDGRVDAIDAALVLQFDAGLLDSLPP